jgi:hypothetical protein
MVDNNYTGDYFYPKNMQTNIGVQSTPCLLDAAVFSFELKWPATEG